MVTILDRLGAFGWIESEHAADQLPEVVMIDRGEQLLSILGERLGREPQSCGEPPRQQLDERDPQREDVGGVASFAGEPAFGSHVASGAHLLGAGLDLAGVERGARDPEVEDPHAATRGEHDVRGFDVAVHDPQGLRLTAWLGGPGGIERIGDRHHDFRRHACGQRAALEQASEIHPVDGLHLDRQSAVDRRQPVHPHDVVVLEQGEQPCLVLQAGDQPLVGRALRMQSFDRQRLDVVLIVTHLGEVHRAMCAVA